MNLREMTKERLRAMLASGLVNRDRDCMCGIDDLMQCSADLDALACCQAAIVRSCPSCGEKFYVLLDQEGRITR